MCEEQTHTEAMLASLRVVPGYVEDVARRMITLAKLHGKDALIECGYGSVTLCARANTSVADIYAQFVRHHRKQRTRLHLVA